MSLVKMKIFSKISIISIFLLCTLCGCNAADPDVRQEESGDSVTLLAQFNIENDGFDDLYLIDESFVVHSDEIKYDADIFEYLSVHNGHIDNSYTIMRSVSYLDHWYRWYAYYFPQFTDEIPYGEGESAIKQYYSELAAETIDFIEAEAQSTFTDGGVIADVAFEISRYSFQTYSASFIGDYLSVIYFNDSYYGGAHSLYGITSDNFDVRTGKLLTLQDVFIDGEDADRLLQACIEKYADPEDPSKYIMQVDDWLIYYFSEDGITFVFNPYVFGSFADGIREITVPYEELESILMIDISV